MMKNLIPAILGPMLVAYGPVDVHPVRGTQRELVLAVAASRSEIVPEVWRDVVLDRLVDRVRTVMVTWEPAPKQLATSDLAEVARDIAEAALDRGSSNASDDAAVLMALSYWEGARWAAYVDDGRCNDRAWRASPEGIETMRRWGDCDGSRAHSLWQIHPVDDPSAPLGLSCSSRIVDGSRLGAARCALAIAEASMNAYGNLAGYTGEDPYGFHPKADKRLEWARQAAAAVTW
jgi:hypothetical protein